MKIFKVSPILFPGNEFKNKFRKKRDMSQMSFDNQIKVYNDQNVVVPAGWSEFMKIQGFEVFETAYNDLDLQFKWLQEKKKFKILENTIDIYFSIFKAQVLYFKPEIIFTYAGATLFLPPHYRKEINSLLKHKIEWVCYWGDELPETLSYKNFFLGFDQIYVSSNGYKKKFEKNGFKSEVLGNSFASTVKYKKKDKKKNNDLIFIGTTGYLFDDHLERFIELKEFIKQFNCKIYSFERKVSRSKYFFNKILIQFFNIFNFEIIDFLKRNIPNNKINLILNDAVYYKYTNSFDLLDIRKFGKYVGKKSIREEFKKNFNEGFLLTSDYFSKMNESKFVLNLHRGEKEDVGNIRCFEATGCETALVTDKKKDMRDWFDVENEIIAFDSKDELKEKLNYFENNPIKYEELILNGKKKTIENYTVEKRCKKLSNDIISNLKKSKVGKKIYSNLEVRYDLNNNPLSFDYLFFLLATFITKEKLELKKVKVILNLPQNFSDIKGFSKDEINFYNNIQNYNYKVNNIIYPLNSYFPIDEFLITRDKKLFLNTDNETLFNGKVVHHNEYYKIVMKNKNLIHRLSAHEKDKKIVREFLNEIDNNKKIITITLRQYQYDISRNSNIEEWAKFCAMIEKDYNIIIVPDQDSLSVKNYPELSKYNVYDQASLNFGLRLALYENSYLNLMINNGPCVACTLSKDVNFLMFKMITSGVAHTSAEFMKESGFEPFKNPLIYHNDKYQELIWEDDKCHIIKKNFDVMVDRLDQK